MEKFPILECLSDDELLVYSDSNFLSIVDVARYWFHDFSDVPSDPESKSSWIEWYWKNYAALEGGRYASELAAVLYSCDIFRRPKEVEEFRRFLRMISAAGELEVLTQCYHGYLENKAQIDRLVSGNSKTDVAGRLDWRGVSEKIGKITGLRSYSKEWGKIIAMSRLDSAASSNERSGWQDYERTCADILRNSDYNIELTKGSGDFGADIIASKSDRRYVIQCKDYARAVGVKAVQEAVAGKLHYLADFAVVVCEAGFTPAAHEFARSADVLLTTSSQLSLIEVSWA